jgi:hypothetical protein
MTNVMEQARKAKQHFVGWRDRIDASPGCARVTVYGLDHSLRLEQHTDTVLKSAVSGAGVYKMRQTKLTHISQALHHRGVEEYYFPRLEAHRLPNGIVNYFRPTCSNETTTYIITVFAQWIAKVSQKISGQAT